MPWVHKHTEQNTELNENDDGDMQWQFVEAMGKVHSIDESLSSSLSLTHSLNDGYWLLSN